MFHIHLSSASTAPLVDNNLLCSLHPNIIDCSSVGPTMFGRATSACGRDGSNAKHEHHSLTTFPDSDDESMQRQESDNEEQQLLLSVKHINLSPQHISEYSLTAQTSSSPLSNFVGSMTMCDPTTAACSSSQDEDTCLLDTLKMENKDSMKLYAALYWEDRM